MVRIELHPEADEEVDAAVDWYDAQREGLGDEFFAELLRELRLIAKDPRSWPPWPGPRMQALGVHRFVMSRFPFALPYMVSEDLVVVLAVAHVRRRPGYWFKRAAVLRRP